MCVRLYLARSHQYIINVHYMMVIVVTSIVAGSVEASKHRHSRALSIALLPCCFISPSYLPARPNARKQLITGTSKNQHKQKRAVGYHLIFRGAGGDGGGGGGERPAADLCVQWTGPPHPALPPHTYMMTYEQCAAQMLCAVY